MKLEAFLPLLRLTDFDFYSLQVGDHAADIEEAGLLSDLIDLSPRLTDFSETAAALSQIDLLISVDTAAVHVAGALGRPVWALIPSAPDWRWGLEGDATAWY
ncbi:MAG: glycosyltransferase family 9 protein [Pseudomonadota bacterium]|nr:glycosyltransferase family 9 protein [Pseudomonadota bacterium]